MVLPGKTADIVACSRLVTLPDWQGLGLAMNLIDRLGACYRTLGRRVHTYPAHPALIRSFGRSDRWSMRKKPGALSKRNRFRGKDGGISNFGGRPNAVFEYIGPPHASLVEAGKLIEGAQ